MRVVFWGKGLRAEHCLREVCATRHEIVLVVTHPFDAGGEPPSLVAAARERGLKVIAPEDPNAPEVERHLASLEADLFVLGGYGKILKQNVISLPAHSCINLHAGRLPEYRGSSPLNWSLVNGEAEFGLSIIEVDVGVDTGDILLDRILPIGPDDTIADLHRTANEHFPQMLREVIDQIDTGTCRPREQDEELAAYYPLRFPEDGLVLWDALSAQQVHNRIRALTEPYPCAFTLHAGRKVRLLSSRLPDERVYGEPGRIYRKSRRHGLLVCASDRCLWVTAASTWEDGRPLWGQVRRYDCLATAREAALAALTSNGTMTA